ncbi:zinc finger protein ZFAT [Anopheles ziemanni]|uniref:zinc finger protein ZFAT n=1 Tax=Anopheles coustani TaxID=139045 RepID=UPI00265A8EA1|nr:zinc finger protein ZFAT [Anopheles coustani]XP_058166949.1 zinc finger protein ZFAT [Anopheles ziemanni]
MLHEDDSELDDTHLCIKCGSTVVGIENYIKHRKVSCTGSTGGQPKPADDEAPGGGSGTVPGGGDEPIGNTDQPTVELRAVSTPSSSGPTSASFGTPFDFGEPIKEPERHKKVPSYEYHNYELDVTPAHHDDHHRSDGAKAPDFKNEENFDYDLGADMFFWSLELQSIIKQKAGGSVGPTATATMAGTGPSPGGSTSGVAGCSPASKIAPQHKSKAKPKLLVIPPPHAEPDQQHQHQHQQQQQHHHQLPDDWLATPNESDKLMKAVSDISGHKKVELYPIFHQESPDPSDDDSEPAGPVDEDEYDAPPRTHTGGKWKPENRPSPNALQRSTQWRHWTPPEPVEKSLDAREEDELDSFKSFSPPPGHTRGKWVPGSKITRLEYKPVHEPMARSSYEDSFWCSICNRRLASRFVYVRHLKSNLHLKRAQEESELERAVRPLYANELSGRVAKPEPSGSSSGRVEEPASEVCPPTESPGKGKRKRKCYYTKCTVCKTRLPTHLLGKHLISRYHYRRMLNHPAQCFDVVLRNMHRIVLESPFQCAPCKFYANSEPHFMAHWNSTEHEARVASPNGKFWCSFCKFECESNFQMTEHLRGANHREVIAVINRSVPIIIRKITRIRCDFCEEEFRYNAELRRHQRHCTEASLEAIEEVRTRVQNTFLCELCNSTFPNRIRLLQHGQKLHRLAHYYCSICECSFETAQESARHRRTSRHKVLSARRRKKTSLVRKSCPVCKEELADVLELKQHIANCHPEVKYSCPRCGECFVLAQELGRHVRDKNCTFFNPSPSVDGQETPSTSLPGPLVAMDSGGPVSPGPSATHQRPLLAVGSSQTSPSSSSSSSSATRAHLPGTNSIISNDSIKVNMNDRKLGKEAQLYSATGVVRSASDPDQGSIAVSASARGDNASVPGVLRQGTADGPAKVDMMENYSPSPPAPSALPPSTVPPYGIKLDSSAPAPATPGRISPPGCESSTAVSSSDCDNIVAVRSDPQASAEIFFALANNASENNTVYVDEIVGTIGEDGSVVCWQCKICPFSTSSKAEFLFHEILHSSKLDDKAKSSQSGPPDEAGRPRPNRPRPKLTCPLCGKAFSKASLRCHLRQHTDERLFPCPLCPMAFTRKANLKNHTDNIHHQRKPAASATVTSGGEAEGELHIPAPQEGSVCTTCGKTFANRHIMQLHSQVHLEQRLIKSFACQYEGCHYQAQSAADARRHLPSHSDERNFACSEDGCDYRGKSLAQLRRHALRHEDVGKKYKCDQCDFATRIPGHLRRHLLVHSGSKPYACPHCDYSCNNIENLRKHVISTSKHKGKFLYECKLCQQPEIDRIFGTNFQKEFKAHLQEIHKLAAEEAAEACKL